MRNYLPELLGEVSTAPCWRLHARYGLLLLVIVLRVEGEGETMRLFTCQNSWGRSPPRPLSAFPSAMAPTPTPEWGGGRQ